MNVGAHPLPEALLFLLGTRVVLTPVSGTIGHPEPMTTSHIQPVFPSFTRPSRSPSPVDSTPPPQISLKAGTSFPFPLLPSCPHLT